MNEERLDILNAAHFTIKSIEQILSVRDEDFNVDFAFTRCDKDFVIDIKMKVIQHLRTRLNIFKEDFKRL